MAKLKEWETEQGNRRKVMDTEELEYLQSEIKRARQEGRREVAESLTKDFEYCDSAGDNFTGIGYFISEDEWHEKLKEWGIELQATEGK